VVEFKVKTVQGRYAELENALRFRDGGRIPAGFTREYVVVFKVNGL